ncbi:MAG TPA: cobalamin-binding protein [Candidatus Acidoferrales bacterium]|nr:cobalamin-binding protein [Candidatus Acidoferrales bacterium]
MARRAPPSFLGLFLPFHAENRFAWPSAAFIALAPLILAALAAASQPRAVQSAARVVTDEIGRRVVVPAEIRRVVSLAPNVTETLYALGVEAKIAGITDFTDLPAGAAPKPSVGEPLEPSLERIAALRPDLVFVAGTINRRETMESLSRLGIPVYATDPHTARETLASIRDIAAVLGVADAGEELAARLEARLDAVRARLAGVAPKRVLFVVWEDPLITTGPGTFIADALRWAGAVSVVNVAEDWPRISLEEVVRQQPDDVILTATHTGASPEFARTLEKRPGWRDLDAVREGRVLVVSDAINRPSPALVDVIEQLARELHPAAFASVQSPPKGGRWLR